MRSLAVVVIAVLGAPALAHETLHQVVPGRGLAVRAYESDGAPLAQTPFEVYSPADPGRAWTTGLTDRDGWLAFVPNAPGRWRVRVVEATGHGLDLAVEAALPSGTPGALPISSAAPANWDRISTPGSSGSCAATYSLATRFMPSRRGVTMPMREER